MEALTSSPRTGRLSVLPTAKEGNRMLALTRKVGEFIVISFLDGNYLLLRLISEPPLEKVGCSLHWPRRGTRDFRECVQITKAGLELVLSKTQSVEISMKGKGYYARVFLSLPLSVTADRWEVTKKKSPRLAKKIVKDFPRLGLTI